VRSAHNHVSPQIPTVMRMRYSRPTQALGAGCGGLLGEGQPRQAQRRPAGPVVHHRPRCPKLMETPPGPMFRRHPGSKCRRRSNRGAMLRRIVHERLTNASYSPAALVCTAWTAAVRGDYAHPHAPTLRSSRAVARRVVSRAGGVPARLSAAARSEASLESQGKLSRVDRSHAGKMAGKRGSEGLGARGVPGLSDPRRESSLRRSPRRAHSRQTDSSLLR
jgi:hypothetical protein